MSQRELEREISRRTGESLGTIRRRGFSIMSMPPGVYEPEPEEVVSPQSVDWDEVDAQRRSAA
jgi:hypothetical protein